jgi:hypothetical protein
MITTLTPTSSGKHCRGCKEYKHRQEFFHRLTGVWDTLCRACQAKPKPLSVLRDRMIKGMISESTFNKTERERKDIAARKGADNLRRWKEQTRAHTWERAERSAVIALKVLNGMPCASEAEHEWREDARELVTTSLQNIRDKKKQEFAPLEQYLFWYDVDRGAAQRLRQLISDFPGDNCPMRMM